MTLATPLPQSTARVAFDRLPWVSLLTSLTAVAAVAVIRQIAVAVLHPNPLFTPLTLVMPLAFTFAAGIGAAIVYAIVGRRAAQPIRTYRRIAAVALLATFIPDVALFTLKFYPGTTAGTVAALLAMHVVAWAIIVSMLTRLARSQA
jgi:hypothetical protein